YACDALACDAGRQILILSAAGPETAIKSLAAALNSDARVKFETEMDTPFFRYYGAVRHPGGYRISRHRMDFNTWHLLALAKADGLRPVLSEEALWQELRSERYTTPLLRSWVPWLMEELKERKGLQTLEQVGCNAGLLVAGDGTVDELVSIGLRRGSLRVK